MKCSNYIISFSGRFLIMYVKTWQTVLKRLGNAHFEFNTYIISVLVIFFLQLELGEENFPTVDKLITNNARINSNITNFRPVLRLFFEFYGNRYQMCEHIISINIGRWIEKNQQINYNFLSPAQKR